VIVVAPEHRRFWERELGDHPKANIILQPENRGTAPGILLPLMWILARDPLARILVVPSDHFVAREEVLARTLREALASVAAGGGPVELLGIEPDADEPGLGWILPGWESGPTRSVRAFVEKPEATAAMELRRIGALWNSFLVAARGSSLIGLYQTRLPALLDAFLREAPHVHPIHARTIYRVLATTDFAQDLLAGSERFLRVRPVPACGWTDLGTVERVVDCLHRNHQRSRSRVRSHATLDLATVLGE
jgi:mannose-1-phosphate guanylyltransferase